MKSIPWTFALVLNGVAMIAGGHALCLQLPGRSIVSVVLMAINAAVVGGMLVSLRHKARETQQALQLQRQLWEIARLVHSAKTTLSVDDYNDALIGAQDRLQKMIEESNEKGAA